MTAQELYDLIGRARSEIGEIRALHETHLNVDDVRERLEALSGLLASATPEEPARRATLPPKITKPPKVRPLGKTKKKK